LRRMKRHSFEPKKLNGDRNGRFNLNGA
jgi:hypothetical protein